MSALKNYYDSGTASVANNSTAVVGVDTLWSAFVQADDIFTANGLSVRIASVTDNDHIVLADPWPGADVPAGSSYEIRIPPPSADVTTSLRALVESINDGFLTQLSEIAFSDGDFLRYESGALVSTTLAQTGSDLAPYIFFGNGTVAAPSIAFAGDTDTGIYNVSANVMGFATGGLLRVSVSSAGLGLRSSGAAYNLNLTTAEVLTADRTLSFVMNNADRTISLDGNFTTSGAFGITLTATGATSVTLPTSGTLATLAGSESLTNKTIDAGSNTLSNITTAMFAAGVIDTDATLSANSDTKIASQKAVKAYFDNGLTGLQWKSAVLCATTANITLSGEQTIDGQVTSGSRVLVKNQTTASQNGLYVSAAGAWTRATDMDSGAEFPSATVFVEAGTVNGDTQWTCTNNAVTVGTTAVTFAQVSGAGTYSAGSGLTLSGNQFSISARAITYAMLQNVGASSLIGNMTGSAAAPNDIGIGATLTFASSQLRTVAMTGDVTSGANSFSTSVSKIAGTAVGGTTGSGNVVFSSGAALSAATLAAIALLGIRSTAAAHDLKIASVEALTADRTLTVALGDTDRTLTLGGNLTTAGGALTFTLSGATNVTLPTTGTLATRAGAETLTNKTISAASNTLSSLDTTMFASGVIDNDSTLSANSATHLATQAAVKAYVDSLVQGLAWKKPVLCVATANITLSGEQTIDGQVTSGSRVLVIAQTTAANNGIYVSAAGAWTRATDADTGAELAWSTVLVEKGTANAGVVYTCNNSAIVLGTDAVNFVQAGVATGTVSAGTGLTLSGSTISIAANGVTYALFQQVVASSLVGNPTGATANAQAISIGATLAFSGSALQTVAMTGDVTAAANSFATTVAKIQGTTVSGVTGSGNVVFSASPTISGTIGGSPQISGTTTNDNASSGNVGQFIESEVLLGSAISLVAGQSTDITSISLPAGDWDVSGNIVIAGSWTSSQYNLAWISTSSATLPTKPNKGALTQINGIGFADLIMPVAPRRISLATTTTVYLTVQAGFTSGSASGYGYIRARRAR